MNNNTPNFFPPQPPVQPPNYKPVKMVKQTKSKFLTFIFSLIPGAGQMYQGLMKRGLSIMILFTGIIAISIFTYIPALIVLLPAVWFYSFFDTINRVNLTREELSGLKDEFLFIKQFKSDNAEKTLKQLFGQRHLLLGWGIIVFSVWLILKIMFRQPFLYNYIPNVVYSYFNFLIEFLPSMIIPAVCIYTGVKLIKGSDKGRYSQHTMPEESKPGGKE
jgi:TM2 domain-containing membrane protein YozV